MREGRIRDRVRQKSVLASPEEQVRQALVGWLLDTIRVPANLISVEFSLSALEPRCRRRADIVVWRPAKKAGGIGGINPWLLAECKAPGVLINDVVADQVRRYAVLIKAEYVLLSNGGTTRLFKLGSGKYGEINFLPLYPA